MLPEPIKKFVNIFSALPSIGPRQATRLAFHVIKLGKNEVRDLAQAVSELEKLKCCPLCFFIHDNQKRFCHICSDPQRKKDIIMVVEKETDLLSLEKAKKFNGRYFILGNLKKGGALGIEQKMKIGNLKNYIRRELGVPPTGGAKEIILAINPTTYGDLNASLLNQELKDYAQKITRLGRGIPTGGEIEFADEDTLGSALDSRN